MTPYRPSEQGFSIEGPDCDLVFATMDLLEAKARYFEALYEQQKRFMETHMHVAHTNDDELLQAAKDLGIDVVPPPLCSFE